MGCIGIGIFEMERNGRDSILKKIKRSNLLLNVPNNIYRLKVSNITLDFVYKNMNIDIYFVERSLEIDILIRHRMGNNVKIEFKSIFKTLFLRKLDQILYAVLYKIFELHDFFLYLRDDSGYYKLYFNEIAYIEIANRATVIHTIGNAIITYKSLKMYMNLLDMRFARCHSGYIVNMDYITNIQYPDIHLLNDETILLSKHKRHQFIEYYNLYIKRNSCNIMAN